MAEDWQNDYRLGQGWEQPGSAVVKAETGSAVYAIGTYPQLDSLSRAPQKLMAEGQALFHTQTWVAAAERAIVGRYVRAPWHLEQADGDTVDKDASPAERAVLDFIRQPNDKRNRRQVWSLTLRHMGLCGNGFWYLDQRDSMGVPLQVLYVNPARMSPVEDPHQTLLGWIMDKPDNPLTKAGSTPVPFELDELIHFKLDEPDAGHWGIGIAEAAYSKLMLDKLADAHTAQVLASGGRIAGLLSPKQGASTMNDDQWLATVRDYRNIVGDPDAAKRLHIVRGPVDFTETASKPSELQLSELSSASRENILAAWGVPLSQIGVMQSSGLNSGEHVKYEEAALWQGPIDYRADSFEEQVQGLIDLFGLGLSLVVETPAFDDQQPLYVNAEKAKVVPLTVDERRALVGLDPLEDKAVGSAIFLDQTMVQINSVTPLVEQEEEPAPVKADLRARTEKQWEPRIREAMLGFLGRQASAIANRVKRNHAHLVTKPTDIRVWWNERQWDAELSELLEPLLGEMAGGVSRGTSRALRPAKADSFLEKVIALVRASAGSRITAINQTTRDEIQRLVVLGVEAGLGPAELAQTISDSTSFNAARAELVARTETMTAYNEAALHTYREFEVTEVEAIDGDDDAECAARNGKRYSIDEAFGIADHPNGTLDWIPVVETAKAMLPDLPTRGDGMEFHLHLPAELTTQLKIPAPEVTVNVPAQHVEVFVPEQPAPIGNVAAAEVNVPPTVVNVEPAVVNVPLAKAVGPQEVRVVSMPTRVHKAQRDRKGQIEGSIEVDA